MFLKIPTTLTVILLSFVSLTFSAVSLSLPSVHPGFTFSDNFNYFCRISYRCSFTDHPGKCWDNDTMKAYNADDVFTIPECTRVTCLDDLSFGYAT